MAVTVNHTGRINLEQKHYKIEVDPDSSGVNCFDLQLYLEREKFDPNSKVHVECWIKNVRRRFDFGRVSLLRKPEDTRLDYLPKTGSPQFRVLLIDDSDTLGKILGHAKSRVGSSGQGASSLLVVKNDDLGEMAWTIEMVAGDRPELVINSRLGNGVEMINKRSDFQALILPAALRMILLNYRIEDNKDEADVVQEQWWSLAEELGGELPTETGIDEFDAWLDNVITGFSMKHEFASAFKVMLENE